MPSEKSVLDDNPAPNNSCVDRHLTAGRVAEIGDTWDTMKQDQKPKLVDAGRLKEFIASVLRHSGLPEADARTVAGLMVEADLQGSDGHGVIRLPQYQKRLQTGGMNPRPNIRVVTERPAMAIVDGDNGMGHLVMSFAAKLAIEKARTAGVAWVGTRASNHAGPASLYARMPIQHDMIGMYFAVGNANHLPPWGGMEMLLSTNPIAVGIPAGSEPPVVLDMATTVAAYGKVKAKAKRGESMPEGWMIDRQGRPLLDPTRAHEGFCCRSAAIKAMVWRSLWACWQAHCMVPRWGVTSSISTRIIRRRRIPARPFW